MTEKILDILYDHSEPDEYGTILHDCDMISAAKDIAQMFAYRFFIREYDYVSGMVSVDYFINDVKSNIAHWSHWTGFTEQQIINSLEKLKAK